MPISDELETRLRKLSRGRAVSVKADPQDFIMALDYQVAFHLETDSFEVLLRRGGCFEGAYRCLERWIEAEAEELDGVTSVPEHCVDLRREMQFWIAEKIYEQFRSDLDSAVGEKVSWLEQARPNEGVFGEITIEARSRSLVGFLSTLRRADSEVRRGVLSPETVELWKAIGIDAFSDAV